MTENILPTPEEEKRHKKMIQRVLRRNKNIDHSTKHPGPKEMKKLGKKLKKEVNKNKDILDKPMH